MTLKRLGSGTGYPGWVTSIDGRTSPATGIGCGEICGFTAPVGSVVRLFASSYSNSHFVGWGGACSGSVECSLVVTGDATVTFQFEVGIPPASACSGMTAGTLGAPLSKTLSSFTDCYSGMGDAYGTLGLLTTGAARQQLHFLAAADRTVLGVDADVSQDQSHHVYLPQPSGFVDVIFIPSGSSGLIDMVHYGSNGMRGVQGDRMQGRAIIVAAPSWGGMLMAGDFAARTDHSPVRHQACLLGVDLTVKWCNDLAAPGVVVGAGVDRENKSLVITLGASHAITAQWFDADGSALTAEFTLLDRFTPGPNTWFDAAQLGGSLIEGTLAVRRVDQQIDSDGRIYRTAQWMLTAGPPRSSPPVPAGAAAVHPAPDWLASRPNTSLAVVRFNAGYALLPMGAPDASCNQRIELVTHEGLSCGFFDLDLGPGRCRTEDVGLGQDGTPIQLVPRAAAPADSCQYRWWPLALGY